MLPIFSKNLPGVQFPSSNHQNDLWQNLLPKPFYHALNVMRKLHSLLKNKNTDHKI